MTDIPILVRQVEHRPAGGIRTRVETRLEVSEDGSHEEYAAADIALARRVSEMLQLHYDGHFWAVHASHKQGVVFITIPLLLGNWKYLIKIANLKSDPGMRSVVKAGGEILERFRIPRGHIDMAAVLAARPIRPPRMNEKPPA